MKRRMYQSDHNPTKQPKTVDGYNWSSKQNENSASGGVLHQVPKQKFV